MLKNEHRFGPPRICAKVGIFADSRFPRLILSRAAAKPARDKINLGNWVPVRVPQTKVVPDGAGAGSADSSSGKFSFGGTLACKYCRSGPFRAPFVQVLPPEFGCRSLPELAPCCRRCQPAARPAARARRSTGRCSLCITALRTGRSCSTKRKERRGAVRSGGSRNRTVEAGGSRCGRTV